MSMGFNLLLLHSNSDIHPRTWLCLRGTKLNKTFKLLEKTARHKNKLSRNAISKLISSKYGCSINTIGRILQGNTRYYPIPILLELLKLNKNSKKIVNQINKDTEYLKVNSASCKSVKAVKSLNKNLSKILGAFMADGSLSIQVVIAASSSKYLEKIKSKLENLKIKHSLGIALSRNQTYISIQLNSNNIKNINKILKNCPKNLKRQTHYAIELTEEYKDSVEAFKNWVEEEFNIQPNRFEPKKNAWRVAYSNKILSRYLTAFFEVIPGPKTYTAFEPRIIRKSQLSIRKSFARGVLMFDGCVSKNNRINISVKSGYLHKSIKEIWKKDEIKFGSYLSKRRSGTEFCLFTTAENQTNKLLEYFERGTQKEKLMRWLYGDVSNNPIIKTRDVSLLSTENILKILRKTKKCDSAFLKTHFKCTHTTVRIYLRILRNQNKIKLSNHPDGINVYVDENTTVLLNNRIHNLIFQKIKDHFGLCKNFAKFLGIHKATLSAWKLRRNRIPVSVLKEFCSILDFDYNEALKSVVKVDREIAEII